MEEEEKPLKKGKPSYPTTWEKLRYGTKPPRTLKQQKRQIYNKTFYPKKNEVVRLVREYPDHCLYDAEGRIYGPMPKNPVMDKLMETTDYDPKTMIEAWMYMPYRESGLFVERSRDRKTPYNMLTVDKMLEFPKEGEEYDLYGFLSDTKVCRMRLDKYLERIRRRSRTGAVLFSVVKVYSEKDSDFFQ